MNSQLAVVLTNGRLDDGNGSQSPKRSGAVLHIHTDRLDEALSCPSGNLQSCSLKQAASNISVQSNGRATGVGGTSQPAPQEMGKPSRLTLPITVRAGRPVLCNQPIRIKVVIPGLCKRPITNSATSSAKDLVQLEPPGHLLGPAAASSGPSASDQDEQEMNPDRQTTTTAQNKTEEKCVQRTREVGAESFHTKTLGETDERGEGERHVAEGRSDGGNTTGPDTPLISIPDPVDSQREQGVSGEGRQKGRDEGDQAPPSLQNSFYMTRAESEGAGDATGRRGGVEDEGAGEEQVEVLDLSLPKKRESSVKEWRYGRFLGHAGCENSLIMEVDEIEGDGDRDIVEEDDGDDDDEEESTFRADDTDMDRDSPLSPSFFPTPVFTSPIDRHSESLLLIDDQGIPYTLTPDGHKVPQIDSSKLDPHPSDQLLVQSNSAEVAEKSLSHSSTLGVTHVGQSSVNSPYAHTEPSGNVYTSPVKVPSQATELLQNLEHLKTAEPQEVPEAGVSTVPQPSLSAAPQQTIQILANPSSNTPFVLLPSTSQLSSTPLALSLPLSLPQSSPGASAPMFLLLSSVPSSSGQSFSTSTPIAVINTSTGQLSQIATSSPSISLPVSSAQVTSPGSSLSSGLSHPIIRLTPNNPPLILSGVSESAIPHSVPPSLSVPSSASSPQLPNSGATMLSSAPQSQTKPNASDPSSDDVFTSTEEAQSEKPQPRSASSTPPPHPTTPHVTSDTSGQSSPGAANQSPAQESEVTSCDPSSESFPLDDHPYFSSGTVAAPSSPPLEPMVPSSQPGDLEALSPPSSPSSLGPRRVLYCQLCPRIFYYLSDLERHSITHSQIKPHVCQQCGKAFKRSSHLQRHKHIHTGQRNFVCPICAKRFREAGELQRHQRVHTGEKPYQCQLCHTRFAERNTLRRHTRRKHPYHQVAMEMLSERRGGGGGAGGGAEGGAGGGAGGGGGEEEESAEWYSSTVSNFGNSESEMDT